MRPSTSVEDPLPEQIVKRFLDLLKGEIGIPSETIRTFDRLFQKGKLSSRQEISKAMKQLEEESV